MVLEHMTQVGGVGRVSPRGFNKEDQEIRGTVSYRRRVRTELPKINKISGRALRVVKSVA